MWMDHTHKKAGQDVTDAELAEKEMEEEEDMLREQNSETTGSNGNNNNGTTNRTDPINGEEKEDEDAEPESGNEDKNHPPPDYIFSGFFAFMIWGPFARNPNDRISLSKNNDVPKTSRKSRSQIRKEAMEKKDSERENDMVNSRGLSTVNLISMETLQLGKKRAQTEQKELLLSGLGMELSQLEKQIEIAEKMAERKCKVYDENNRWWKHVETLIDRHEEVGNRLREMNTSSMDAIFPSNIPDSHIKSVVSSVTEPADPSPPLRNNDRSNSLFNGQLKDNDNDLGITHNDIHNITQTQNLDDPNNKSDDDNELPPLSGLNNNNKSSNLLKEFVVEEGGRKGKEWSNQNAWENNDQLGQDMVGNNDKDNDVSKKSSNNPKKLERLLRDVGNSFFPKICDFCNKISTKHFCLHEDHTSIYTIDGINPVCGKAVCAFCANEWGNAEDYQNVCLHHSNKEPTTSIGSEELDDDNIPKATVIDDFESSMTEDIESSMKRNESNTDKKENRRVQNNKRKESGAVTRHSAKRVTRNTGRK